MQISIGENPFNLSTIGLEVPGIQTPVVLRPGTSDEPTFVQVFVEKQYNFDFGSFVPKFIIDGGANVGFASVFFKNIFPNAKIVAIEPDSSNCGLFLQNLHAYKDVELIEGALWSEKGTGYLIKEQDGTALEHWAFKVSDKPIGNSSPTPLYTVGEIAKLSGAESIDILKLDIEGAEEEIFSDNCESWLPLVNVLILEFHEQFRPGSAERIINKLLSSNWKVSENGEHFMFTRT